MVSEPTMPSVGAPSSARLELESRPETLALVRAVLGGLAEYVSIDPELLDDLKTAVSEACNNVVQHAYPDGWAGPLRLELFLLADAIVALVRDTGIGLDERTLSSDADAGVGIPVIRTLAGAVRFRRPDPGGTELSMAFAVERAGQRLIGLPLPSVDATLDRVPDPMPPPAGAVSGSVSPSSLLGPVLGRLARSLAAACHFSLDRFSDVYLVTDAIGALMSAAPADRSWFTVRSAPQRLELVVGPLAEGSVDRLRGSTGRAAHPSALLVLSDELSAEKHPDGYEMLYVVIADSASLD